MSSNSSNLSIRVVLMRCMETLQLDLALNQVQLILKKALGKNWDLSRNLSK